MMFLWGLNFAQAREIDSLKTDFLKRQKLLYSIEDNWLPPELPSGPEFVEVGCCLLPISGCVIARGVFRKESQPESLHPQDTFAFNRTLWLGLEYSLGLAGTGVGYPKGGMEMIDPFKIFYWMNYVSMKGIYRLSSSWESKLGIGYLWGEMTGRLSVFIPLSDGEVPHFCSNANWQISAVVPCILVKKNWGRRQEKFLEFGLEYYFAKGINYETKAYTFTPVTITTWGQSVGGILGFGLEKNLYSKVKWNLAFLARVGWIMNPRYTATEEVVREASFSLNFTGIYLKMGVNCLLPQIF